ncbi:MAG: response regulator [bacterium]
MKSEINKKIRILHVDDEQDTLVVVKTILEKEGYEVVSVTRGKKALEDVMLDGFGLIIIDVMMPDMSGWELFTRIAQVKPDYKIIFLSILELSPEKKKELFASGIKDYIGKPFDRADFVKRVKQVINN